MMAAGATAALISPALILPALAIGASLTISAASQSPLVTTTSGTIRGVTQDGVDGYLGIPFAAPPSGALRFAMPVAHPPWTGVRNATVSGAHCVQGAGPAAPAKHDPCPPGWCAAHNATPDECGCGVCGSFGGCTFSCSPGGGRLKCPSAQRPPAPPPAQKYDPEDCLFINAFTPSAATRTGAGDLAPVMVHIHGGGFVGGAATAAWDLTRDTGSVVFSIQYRLGALGFFGGGGGLGGGGFGMADQQFALQWVRVNAKAFGGDASKTMIFGCSAGGASVAGHLVLPKSRGLFRAAGIESPGGHQGWEAGTDRSDDDWMSAEMNLMFSDQLAKKLGCQGKADLDCLRQSNLKTLYTESKKLHFAPAMDKEGSFPLGEIGKGNWAKVPTIVGGQSCESCNAAALAFGFPNTTKPVTKQAFDAALLKAGFTGTELLPNGKNKTAVGPALLEQWYANRIKNEGRWRTFARINSDSGHACSATLHAKALGQTYDQVYRYFFDYVRPGSRLPGATHGGDESWLLRKAATNTAAELALSRDMANWWTTLGRTLNPNDLKRQDAPRWTPYVPGTHEATMFLDAPPRMNQSIDTVRVECDYWKPYLGWMDEE